MDLGSRVRDVITGFEGIAIGRCENLFSGPDICVQSESLSENGEPRAKIWFEESRIEVKNTNVISIVADSGSMAI